MKALLVAETREGKLLGTIYELAAFARALGAETSVFLVGADQLPKLDGRLYLAPVARYGEFNPDAHKALLLAAIDKEQPDLVVLPHSSYGWDLAPRIALALGAAQVSEVVEVRDGALIVPVCHAKLRRRGMPETARLVAEMLELAPGGTLFSPGGGAATHCFVYVLEGSLEMDTGGVLEVLDAGDCASL